MARLNWSKAKKFRASEPANPGGKSGRQVLWVDNWEDLERVADGREPLNRGRKRLHNKTDSAPDSLEAKLLHQIVMALNNQGKGSLLADLPEVLAYFGGTLPTVADVVGGQPESAVITGDIAWDDRVWSFSCTRLVKRQPAHTESPVRPAK